MNARNILPLAVLIALSGCGLPFRTIEDMESRECEIALPDIDPGDGFEENAWLIRDHMEERFEAEGIDIQIGRPLFGARATSYWNRVVVESGFWDLPDGYIAGALVHEFVHACQRKKLGHARFVAKQATALGRLRTETPAYRFGNIATYRHLGLPLEPLDTYRHGELDSLRETYRLGLLDPDQYEPEVMRVWTMDDRS